MRKLVRLLAPALALCFSMAFQPVILAQKDPGRSSWQGLWELTEKNADSTASAFLWVSPKPGEAPLFLGEYFDNRLLTKWNLEDTKISLNWLRGSSNILYEGMRSGTKVSGTWKRVHPQYRQSDSFSGVQISARKEWVPLGKAAEVQTYQGVVDLSALLGEQSTSTLEEFKSFWNESFYPDFVSLIRRAPRISSVFQTIRKSGFDARTKRIAETCKQVLRDVKREFPELKIPKHFVIQPFAAPESRYLVGDSVVVAVDAEGLDAGTEGETLSRDFGLRLLRGLLEPPPALQREARKMVARAMPSYMILQLNFAGSIANALQLDEETYQALAKSLPEIRKSRKAGARLSQPQMDVLAYDFVTFLLTDQSLIEILGSRDKQLEDGLREYYLAPSAGRE